jgi:hypothetical protein
MSICLAPFCLCLLSHLLLFHHLLLGHDHVPSSDEVPLLSILSSGIFQVDALLAIPKAKEFVQTLVAMDTCCGLDLIREDMVPKDAIVENWCEVACLLY